MENVIFQELGQRVQKETDGPRPSTGLEVIGSRQAGEILQLGQVLGNVAVAVVLS